MKVQVATYKVVILLIALYRLRRSVPISAILSRSGLHVTLSSHTFIHLQTTAVKVNTVAAVNDMVRLTSDSHSATCAGTRLGRSTRLSVHPVATAGKQSGRRAESSERELDNVPLFDANSLHRLEHRLSSVLHTQLSFPTLFLSFVGQPSFAFVETKGTALEIRCANMLRHNTNT